MSFNLQGSDNVPCSSFYRSALNFVHLCSIFLSICSTSQGSLVSLVCQRSNFVLPLPLPFLPGDISRISGRDPLLVWESCDARRPTSQKIPEDSRCSGLPVCSFVLVLFIFALHHVIMPSCHFFILHLNLNKSCGPSVHLNRGKVTSLYNISSQYLGSYIINIPLFGITRNTRA